MNTEKMFQWLTERFPNTRHFELIAHDAAARLCEELRQVEAAPPAGYDRDRFLQNRAGSVLSEASQRIQNQTAGRSYAARLMTPPVELLERGSDLPGRDQIDEEIVREQVRLLLPESFRRARHYSSLVDWIANEVVYLNARLWPNRREAFFRSELENRGAIVRGAAPEALVHLVVLRSMEEMSPGNWDRVSAETARERIRERDGLRSDQPLRQLVEALHAASRLAERR